MDRKIRKIGQIGVINAPLCHNEGQFIMVHYLKKKVYYADGIRKYIESFYTAMQVTFLTRQKKANGSRITKYIITGDISSVS